MLLHAALVMILRHWLLGVLPLLLLILRQPPLSGVMSARLDIREKSISAVPQFVAPGGTLLLIFIGTDSVEGRTGLPWPLTREEVALFARDGLVETKFEELPPSGSMAAVCWRGWVQT